MSQTGPIGPTMGKLPMGDRRTTNARRRSRQARPARAAGQQIGRPRRIFDRAQVLTLRDEHCQSWAEIARATGESTATVRRAYRELSDAATSCQNPLEPNL
jgi:DNA invertase Pin-like site-specific DNA recombinase